MYVRSSSCCVLRLLSRSVVYASCCMLCAPLACVRVGFLLTWGFLSFSTMALHEGAFYDVSMGGILYTTPTLESGAVWTKYSSISVSDTRAHTHTRTRTYARAHTHTRIHTPAHTRTHLCKHSTHMYANTRAHITQPTPPPPSSPSPSFISISHPSRASEKETNVALFSNKSSNTTMHNDATPLMYSLHGCLIGRIMDGCTYTIIRHSR